MRTTFAFALVFALGCSHPTPAPTTPSSSSTAAVSPEITAAVSASDRTEADRALDAQRHPQETLSFFGIRRGMRVADLFAGGGYTTELLARTVGTEGRVYGQNTPMILQRFAEAPWSARLATPAMANVTRVDRDMDDPLPAEATNLDAVIFVLSYHDTVWTNVDRTRMNAAVFRALRSGGVYGIVDHAAAAGHGVNDVQTLHRIEQSVVVSEITAAGFRLDGEATFLQNPNDTHDWNDSPREAGARRGTSDRFVLRFVKP